MRTSFNSQGFSAALQAHPSERHTRRGGKQLPAEADVYAKMNGATIHWTLSYALSDAALAQWLQSLKCRCHVELTVFLFMVDGEHCASYSTEGYAYQGYAN